MENCSNCPIGPGCHGLKHRRLCELKETREDYRLLLFQKAGLSPELPIDRDREPVVLSTKVKTTTPPPSNFRTAATGKVRIGLLSPNLNAGGAESVQLQLLKGLDQTKFHHVGMVVGDPMENTDASMTSMSSEFVPIQYGLDKIASLASQCDVLVSWMVEDMTKWMGGSQTPFVYIDHFPHTSALNSMAQKCLQGAATVVGVSSLCSPAWTSTSWASRYQVIPNAVDTSRLQITQTKAQMYQKWGIAPIQNLSGQSVLPPVAGSYCRVHVDRRPDAVVRAITSLPTNWHVVLVGEQNSVDELQYLNNMISQMPASMAARVHIMPEDSSSGNVLNAFDVVVSAASGVTESFGLTMAEALYLGRPVVATPFGLAAIHPEFVYPVVLDDTALTLATQIVAAKLGGCRSGAQNTIQATYSPTNFITSWTSLLISLTSKKMPSVTQLGRNFAKAVVNHAADGFRKTPQEIQDVRMATCRSCDFYDQPSGRCRHGNCGCWINRKVSWQSEKCPIGKWEQ